MSFLCWWPQGTDAVLQVGHHPDSRGTITSLPTGHPSSDAAQGTVSLLVCKCTLLGYTGFLIYKEHKFVLLRMISVQSSLCLDPDKGRYIWNFWNSWGSHGLNSHACQGPSRTCMWKESALRKNCGSDRAWLCKWQWTKTKTLPCLVAELIWDSQPEWELSPPSPSATYLLALAIFLSFKELICGIFPGTRSLQGHSSIFSLL